MGLEFFGLYTRVNELGLEAERHQRALRSLTGWGCAVCVAGSMLTPWVTEIVEHDSGMVVRSSRFDNVLLSCSGSCVDIPPGDSLNRFLEALPLWVALLGLVLLVVTGTEEAATSAAHQRCRRPGMLAGVLGLVVCLLRLVVIPASSQEDEFLVLDNTLVGPGLPLLAMAVVCAAVRSAVPYRPLVSRHQNGKSTGVSAGR